MSLCLGVACCLCALGAPTAQANLIHHYTFEEVLEVPSGSPGDERFIEDQVGSATGTILPKFSPYPVLSSTAAIGSNSIDFEGSERQELDFDAAGSLTGTAPVASSGTPGNEKTFSWSVAGWVNPESLGGARYIYQEANGNQERFGFRVDGGGQLEMETWGDGISTFHSGSNTIAAGQWSHVAYVQDHVTPQRRFYINGVRAGQSGTLAQFNAGSAPIGAVSRFSIGGRVNTAPGSTFDGLIDDMGFWDNALTDTSMAAIHALGRFEGLALSDPLIADLLDAFTSQAGVDINGNHWAYTDDLGITTVGTTGGDAGVDAFVVLDDSGAGMQITPADTGAAIPEPTVLGLLAPLVLGLFRRSC